MTTIVCISDTHSLHGSMVHAIPDGDILIHAGDLTGRGTLGDVQGFNAWMRTLPHRHKLVIAGNHDSCFEQERERAAACLDACIYLQDSSVEIEGLLFYGSPWQPRFMDWAFNADPGRQLASIWARVPARTDVLITHGPPRGVLDQVADGSAVGCVDLRQRIERIRPRLHVFGHVHEAYGRRVLGGTTYVNASTCSEDYRPVNAPLVVELAATVDDRP